MLSRMGILQDVESPFLPFDPRPEKREAVTFEVDGPFVLPEVGETPKASVTLGQPTTIVVRKVPLGQLHWERRYKGDLFALTDPNGNVVYGGPRRGWRAMALGNLYGRRALVALDDLDQLERRWRTQSDRVKQGIVEGQALLKRVENSTGAISARTAKDSGFGDQVHKYLRQIAKLPSLAYAVEEADANFRASLNRLGSWLKQGEIDKAGEYIQMKESEKAQVKADVESANAILGKVLSMGALIVGFAVAPGVSTVVGLISEGAKDLGGAVIDGKYGEALGALDAQLSDAKVRLAQLKNQKYALDVNAARDQLEASVYGCKRAAEKFQDGATELEHTRATAYNVANTPATKIISELIMSRTQQFQNIARLRAAGVAFLKLQEGLVSSLKTLGDHYRHVGDWIDDISAADRRLARNSPWANVNEWSAYANVTKLGEWDAYVPGVREACRNALKAVDEAGAAAAMGPYEQGMKMVDAALNKLGP